ncbi:MAG: cohesin domain-containing protein [Patescibacteria group bacterium]
MKKIFLALSVLIITFCVNAYSASAAGASLYLSPNSGTFYVGSTFDVSIFLNTGNNNINAVYANLKFDPKKLQIASPTAGRSFISVWIAQPTYSNKDGLASFLGGNPSPGINTTAGLVSTVTFRAITPGETEIYFLDTSQALLDDGKGTNILNSKNKGVYQISVPPPEGPEIFSATHPDQNKWHKDNNPTFSWTKEENVSDFSYGIDHDPRGVPDSVSEGAANAISYSDLGGGVWYFHVKAKKAGIWGGTSNYLVQIDADPPAGFTPKIEPSPKTSVSQPIVSFITTDALSGFDHFELKVINITPGQSAEESGFFTEVASPYKLPNLLTGKYLLIVRAFDKAGNWRDSSTKLEIFPRGLHVSGEGVSFFGLFLEWQKAALLIFIIVVLIVIFILIKFKKQRARQREIAKKLKEREAKIKEEAENINMKTGQIK